MSQNEKKWKHTQINKTEISIKESLTMFNVAKRNGSYFLFIIYFYLFTFVERTRKIVRE